MKKLLVFGFALFLVAAFTLPAAAVEHKFGGFFRTRFLNYFNARGVEDTGDIHLVDTRTRLFYTAVLNENLKFVFKNEFDADWGGGNYGQLAADGLDHQVKNAYIDFNLGDFNFLIGTQGFVFARGLLVDEDASGISLIWRGNKNIIPALYWFRLNEGDNSTAAGGSNSQDSDIYHGMVVVKASKMQIVPHFTYWYANDGNNAQPVGTDQIPAGSIGTLHESLKIWWAGLDFSMKFDNFDFILGGIYNGGDVDDTVDVEAYLLNAKAAAKFGNFGVHGEFIYATGDDNTDNTVDAFIPTPGASYTWSEGYAKGDIDDQPFRSPLAGGPFGSKEITDLMAFNLGASFNITKTWTAKFDFWNINLAEDNAVGDKDIGNEISLKFKGKLAQNLDVLLVGAYMFAGDAFNGGVANEADPFELAMMLSISF